jgi:hypothetical protein
MAVFHLATLVLRGVSVVSDGPAVGLRLGSYETESQAKATPISMRHPSPGQTWPMIETRGRQFPKAYANGNCDALRAGRPGSRAGVLVRRSPAPTGAGGTTRTWFHTVGGPSMTAVTSLCPIKAKRVATVADATSAQRPSNCIFETFIPASADDKRSQVQPAPLTGPDTRTPTAVSTRGNRAMAD